MRDAELPQDQWDNSAPHQGFTDPSQTKDDEVNTPAHFQFIAERLLPQPLSCGPIDAQAWFFPMRF
jgi:hypothetical protein